MSKWDNYQVSFQNGYGEVIVQRDLPIRQALVVYLKAIHNGFDPLVQNKSIGSILTKEQIENTMKTLLTIGHYNTRGLNSQYLEGEACHRMMMQVRPRKEDK